MADLNGFVKIYRQIIKWGWYRDIPVKVLFLHCLFMANYQEAHWYGKTIGRGSFVTSIDELSQQTGLTVQKTRTALKKLILTGEITKKSTNKYTVITVVNYEKFQNSNKSSTIQSTSALTNEQQTANKQLTSKLTTNEEYKEIKNIKEDKEAVEVNLSYSSLDKLKVLYPDVDWDSYDEQDFALRPANFYAGQKVVFLSAVQEDFLLDALGAETTQYYVGKLADFIINKKARVKNHYATILKWHNQDTAV